MADNCLLTKFARKIDGQTDRQKECQEIHSNAVDPVLNDRELAKALDPTGKIVTPWRIRKWRLEGGMPCFSVGKRIFFRLSSVLKWIADKETESVSNKQTQEFGKVRRID